VVIAASSNAVAKSALALTIGGRRFGQRIAAALLIGAALAIGTALVGAAL
jgi:uncharacterized membrane protein (DUF4010 family)